MAWPYWSNVIRDGDGLGSKFLLSARPYQFMLDPPKPTHTISRLVCDNVETFALELLDGSQTTAMSGSWSTGPPLLTLVHTQ